MKTLFLIRHAKSSWDDTALPDKDRPLNDRGQRDAPKMGERLAKRDVKPDLILSSPAVRALRTAEIIAKKLDYRRKIVVNERLYAVGADDLLDVIITKSPQILLRFDLLVSETRKANVWCPRALWFLRRSFSGS